VAAGAIAKRLLQLQGVHIQAYVSQVGAVGLTKTYQEIDLSFTETNDVRCPDPTVAAAMIDLITRVRKAGDTVGGVISAVVRGCPPGLGQPVFDKLNADLAKAMLSINAAKGFEYGSGFSGVAMLGSQHNDVFAYSGEPVGVRTLTNHSGGIQGGISNGMDIYFRVAFKPVATLMRDQTSINTAGDTVVLKGKGRHDPCVVPRAVPIVEAMAALVLADHLLLARADRV
jgi:chorismate synthase